jgi:phosphatidylglycerophosphate synthase
VDLRVMPIRFGARPKVSRPNPVTALRQTPPVLLAWTLGRLGLVPIVIAAFVISPPMTAVALLAFIAADLYDGVLARELEADDTSRRVLDSLVDRISIWSVYIAISVAGYLPVALLALLLLRDVYCGVWCYRMVSDRNVAIRADWMHRSLNLMLAGWVVAVPLLGGTARSAVFGAILLFSLVVAADLRRCVLRVLSAAPTVRDAVLPAKDLRAS